MWPRSRLHFWLQCSLSSFSGPRALCTLEHIHRPCQWFWFKLGQNSDEWQLLQSLRDSAAKSDKKIAVSCSHGRNLEHLVDLDWFDSNFCIKSLAQILMYQVCVHESRNRFSRNVQISTYTGYKSLAGNVCLLLGQIWRGKEVPALPSDRGRLTSASSSSSSDCDDEEVNGRNSMLNLITKGRLYRPNKDEGCLS